MKAYLIPQAPDGDRWQRTQDDVRLMAKHHGGLAWSPVELPTTHQSWIDFLNEHDRMVVIGKERTQLADELLRPGALIPDAIDEQGQIRPEIEKLLPKVPGRCDACGRSVAGTLKLAIGNDVDALEAWAETIQADNLWALGRAADIILNRARELGAEWAERSVQ